MAKQVGQGCREVCVLGKRGGDSLWPQRLKCRSCPEEMQRPTLSTLYRAGKLSPCYQQQDRISGCSLTSETTH